MQYLLNTEIEIAAPPDQVWQHLISMADYGEWNPFIVSVTGTPELGQRLTVRLQPPGGRGATVRPTVTELSPGRVLEWFGRLGLPGIFDARHRFELQGIDTGTRLVQSESFTGLLVRPMRRSLDGSTRAGFLAMNEALAHRVIGGRQTAGAGGADRADGAAQAPAAHGA